MEETVKYFGRKMRHGPAVTIAMAHLSEYLGFQFIKAPSLSIDSYSRIEANLNGATNIIPRKGIAILNVVAYVNVDTLNIIEMQLRKCRGRAFRQVSVAQHFRDWYQVSIDFYGGIEGVEEFLRWSNDKHKLTTLGA